VEAARGHLHGRVLRAALPDLPLVDGSAAAIAANFVVNHVGRPRAALAELRRALRPGGLLAMTIWPAGGASLSAMCGEVLDAARALPPPERRPAHQDFTRPPARLAALAGEAGLDVEQAGELHSDWRTDPEDLWTGLAAGIATPGAVVRAQTQPVRARIREIFSARTAEIEGPDGILHFPVRAAYVLATRPLTEEA